MGGGEGSASFPCLNSNTLQANLSATNLDYVPASPLSSERRKKWKQDDYTVRFSPFLFTSNPMPSLPDIADAIIVMKVVEAFESALALMGD